MPQLQNLHVSMPSWRRGDSDQDELAQDTLEASTSSSLVKMGDTEAGDKVLLFVYDLSQGFAVKCLKLSSANM